MCHAIPLERLDVDSPTVPLAELLLTKLQIVRLNEKDVKDIAAILLEHPVGEQRRRDDQREPGGASCSPSDWGLWRTSRGSIEFVRAALDGLALSPVERDLIRERLDTLWERVEREPKPLKFRTRARVGDRTRWYEEPDEVEHREPRRLRRPCAQVLHRGSVPPSSSAARRACSRRSASARATPRGPRTCSSRAISPITPRTALMRVPGYLAAIERGETNPRAVPRVVRDEGATATVDGELGLGQVVARAATAEAVARARLHGISCVAVRRCCHVGRLAHFAGLIADEGQIGIVAANDAGAGQVVAPPGATGGAPLDEPARDRRAAATAPAFVLDMSTSVVSHGKVQIHRERGERCPTAGRSTACCRRSAATRGSGSRSRSRSSPAS